MKVIEGYHYKVIWSCMLKDLEESVNKELIKFGATCVGGICVAGATLTYFQAMIIPDDNVEKA